MVVEVVRRRHINLLVKSARNLLAMKVMTDESNEAVRSLKGEEYGGICAFSREDSCSFFINWAQLTKKIFKKKKRKNKVELILRGGKNKRKDEMYILIKCSQPGIPFLGLQSSPTAAHRCCTTANHPSTTAPMVRERKYLGAETNASVSIICNCCCKRCARKRQRRCLPQEIIFDILLHLPALVIRDVMRHVCREWNLMIRSPDFIHHHLRNSTVGIIIQPFLSAGKTIYVEMRRGCLEISEFDCGFAHPISTTCNGLTLIPDLRDLYTLYVINPLMKQRTVLPPFPNIVNIHSEFKLAFVEASMEYKVVNARGRKPLNPPKQIAMLTIGVDRVWRHIGVEHLPLTARIALTTFPLVTGGYIHWIGETFVLTLNAETETFCEFPMPQLERRFGKFLPMDGNLSVVYRSNELSRDVWEMDSETGEWTMLLSFDLKPLYHRFKDLLSKNENFKDLFSKNERSVTYLGWLAVREVLVLSTICFQRHCIAYNVKTGEIQSFELGTDCSDTKAKAYNFVAHVNSLVCLEGGF